MPKKTTAIKKATRKVTIKPSKNTKKKIIKVATATAAGLAAAGTAAYMFTGKRGVKTRKEIKKTIKVIEKQAQKEGAAAKKIAKKVYGKAVDAISSGHKQLQNLDADDFMELTGELKKRWGQVTKQAQGASKSLAKLFPPAGKPKNKTQSKRTLTKKRR